MLDLNTDKTNEKVARMSDLSLSSIYVAGSHFNASSANFDYSSKRAQKDAQRVARPPRVQHFELVLRDAKAAVNSDLKVGGNE